MNQNCNEPNGYLESINKGIQTVRSLKGTISRGKGTKEEQLKRLAEEIRTADAIVIGAGAGLSTSAGLTYAGERFDKYFGDFAKEYGIRDMYSGGFYPFPDDNVDHQFQKAGFDRERLFCTQGDYGLWQCSRPCHQRTYDNKGKVVKMLLAQGFAIGENSGTHRAGHGRRQNGLLHVIHTRAVRPYPVLSRLRRTHDHESAF